MECYTCHENKPEDEFNWRKTNIKRSGVCKECHKRYRHKHYIANKKKYIAKAKRWKKENGGTAWQSHRVSKERFEELKSKYAGKCWSCHTSPAVCIDHDHNCCKGSKSCGNCIRGVLCAKCNTGIAFLGDTLEGVSRAVEYLKRKS